MKTFDDLEFKEHSCVKGAREAVKRGIDMNEYLNAKQALLTFDNGKEISVLFGSVFYSNGVDTYEAWCQAVNDEPRGYLTKDEVTNYMRLIQNV